MLADVGSKEKPSGKPGNCVTRMWARTGWWTLKRESETWEKAIKQFGVDTPTPSVRGLTDWELTNELRVDVRIRQVVLDVST